jgi:DNA-binding transcriptional regulator YiaG
MLDPEWNNRVQNDLKKRKTDTKRTHLMDADMLKNIREEIGFAPRDMYRTLGIPWRTYQDYEAGKRGIPDDVASAVLVELKWNREFMTGLPCRVDRDLEREFPGGVCPSFQVEKEEE